MNAAAAHNGGGDSPNDLRRQRDQLLAEVERLKKLRNDAITAANALQTENAALKRRIEELEGNS